VRGERARESFSSSARLLLGSLFFPPLSLSSIATLSLLPPNANLLRSRRGLGTFTVPPRLGRRTRAASRSPSPSQGAEAAHEEPAAEGAIFDDAAAVVDDQSDAHENNNSSQQPPAARRRRTSGGSAQAMQPDNEPLDDGAAEPMEGKKKKSLFFLSIF